MKPRFKAEDRVILVGNRKLWGTPGNEVSSSIYHTIPPGTPGTVDQTNAAMPLVRFDGFEGRHCLYQKWLVPESPSDEDIFEVLPGCDTTPLGDDITASSGLRPAMLVHFVKPACVFTGQWRVRIRDTASEYVVGPKWLRLVETEETAPTVELWAVSPGVEIPRSIFGYDFKCSDPTLLQITVDASGKRTFVRCFIFGTGDASWHMLSGHVRLVDIDCRGALEPYLPKTRLTRAEIAEKLGVDNLEIVD